MLRTSILLSLLWMAQSGQAETILVPQGHKTIQAAIDAAEPGDTVLVSPGRFTERIHLKPGITLRSAGDQRRGEIGLKRAEMTVLDGGGKSGGLPGVIMAEGSTLDGITVTNVGLYDETTWSKHFESQGEQLGDDEGSVQSEGTVPAISIQRVNCHVVNNIVHHNGDVGIAVIGDEMRRITPRIAGNVAYRNLGGGIGVAEHSEPVIQDNVCKENLRAGIGCRNSRPFILDNECFQNIRAGIGCREGAMPVMRGNKCYQNRRAGIGIRMEGTAPVVEHNECYENEMAGIGCRDGAVPILRSNKCYKNKMAGIGCDGAMPLIVGNECRDNEMAGIGLRGAATATIVNNRCIENKLAAIGVTHGSTATLIGNRLVRTGGMPPLVAVRDDSAALIQKNVFEGGGVAALLVQGSVTVNSCQFVGRGEKQGSAVWVWEGSTATISSNTFDGYRAAVNATKATLVITGNTIHGFSGPAITVKDSPIPAHAYGNMAISNDEDALVVKIEGPAGIVGENTVKRDEAGEGSK